MLMTLNDVQGCQIQATDGPIGKSKDFFFDDHSWSIRYLVVDTGWLFGRTVLTAPEAIEKIDVAAGEISISLNKKQLKNSPGVGTDLPVSRQEEMKLREYYNWPSYWDVYPSGMPAAPLIPTLKEEDAEPSKADAQFGSDAPIDGDDRLRSASEVQGYHIEAKDGEIGHVEDFVVDDEAWTIRYVVVDTRNWLPGRKVLLAPTWAEGIDWAKLLVRVNLDREEIEKCPPYDPDSLIARDYERAIHEHLERKPYWV